MRRMKSMEKVKKDRFVNIMEDMKKQNEYVIYFNIKGR